MLIRCVAPRLITMPHRFPRLRVLLAWSLLLSGGQAVIGQPPSLDGETNSAVTAARAAISAVELEAARAELLSLSERYPRSLHPVFPDRSRALVEAAALARQLGATNAAAGELLQVLEREPESEWTPRAHLEMAELVLARGNWQLAADHLRQARAGALGQTEGDVAGTREAVSSRVDVARVALERMTRIHRLVLRPLAGRSPWTRTRIYLTDDYLPDPLKLKKPRTVAAGLRGDLLVTDNNRVVLLGREGDTVASRDVRGVVRASLGPAGPLGGLRALVATRNSVIRVGGAGDAATVTFERPSGGRLDEIVGVYREPFGDWIVLSRRVDVVLRYDRNGRLRNFSSSTVTRPADLAPGPGGSVHVLDAGSRSSRPALLTFDESWQLTKTIGGDWQRPTALDVDAFGNSYVLDEDARRILVYGRDGAQVAVLGPVLPGGIEVRAPMDIAVDGMGRVFIAEGRLETVLVVE